MSAFFSSDGSLILQFLTIFGLIVVAMAAVYLIYRSIAGRGLSMSVRSGNRSRQPRLGIVDIYELDRQRQLILLRRDNVEHLLLVGGPNDVVVERNVQRGGGPRLPGETMLRPEPAPDLTEERASDPAARDPVFPPSFEMPVTMPPPPPGMPAQPDAAPPPLDPELFEPQAPRPEPADAAGARARAGRFLRRTPPPLVSPRPAVASEQPRPEEPAARESAPFAAGAAQNVDPAILSDMARQLEVALRRPSSAVTPAPNPSVPPAPEPAASPIVSLPSPEPAAVSDISVPPPTRPADPIAAGMAASQVLNPPDLQAPPTTPAAPPEPPAQTPPPPPAPEPERPSVPRPAPPPAAPAAPPPPRPGEPKAEPAGANPFSVEEIEAEFARLLGRPLDKKT